jgi:flagellar hook protein FlgE
MSLSGALTSAVTGIDAQSIALGSISDNISNSQTTGYKRVDTAFSTLLTVSNAFVHEPGGVTSRPLYTNDVQGTVESTGNVTNLAVSGTGMFAVSQALGTASTSSLPTFAPDPLFTREGDFQVDNNGFLVNNGGYFLNGFAINQATGAVEKNQLVPIQLNELKSNPVATTKIDYSANLPTTAAQTLNTGSQTPITTGAQQVTFAAGSSFQNKGTLAVNVGPAPGTTTTFVFSDTSLPAGSQATAAAPQILVPFDSTQPLSAQIAALQTALAGAGIQNSLDSSGNLSIGPSTALGVVPTTLTFSTASAGPPATVATLTAAPTVSAAQIPANIAFAPTKVSFFDAQGASHDVDVNWTKVSGTNDTYEVTYTSSDPAIITIQPLTPTLVKFNVIDNPATGAKAGSIASISPLGGPIPIPQGTVGSTATVPLTVNFGGSNPTSQTLSFNFGQFGVAQQTTMFTGTDVNFISAQQDGLPPGSFRDLDIDASGNITLNFDNGARKTEFQIPLVQFSNFNGLQPQSGNAYSTTVASGNPSINSPGDNGTGHIVSSSVEGSNVDIAAEFTKLIQTQRAYEANTKVVTTTDTLLEETDNLIR